MPTTATLNTMSEGLMKIAKDITALMALPNADIDFLTNLQTSVLGYVQHANQPNASLPPPGPDNPFPQAPGGGGPPGMPPDVAALMGGGGAPQGITPAGMPPGPGPAARPGPPNPDELRRLLS